MKKLPLNLAILAAMGFAGQVGAVNLSDSSADDELYYASELDASGDTGLDLLDNANVQDLTATLGSQVADGSSRFVAIRLNNGASFVADPALTITDNDSMNDTVSTSLTLINQDRNLAIFSIDSVTGGDNSAGASSTVEFDIEGVNITSTDAAITASYGMFLSEVAAQNNQNAIASASKVAYRFANALVAEAAAGTPKDIEVAEQSLLFAGGAPNNESPFGSLTLSLNDRDGSGIPFNASSASIATVDQIVAAGNTELVLSGDFSSALEVAVDGGTFFPLSGDDAPATENFLSSDRQTLTLDLNDGKVSFPSLTNDPVTHDFVFKTDGETVIAETQFSATLNFDGAAGNFALPDSLGPFSLGEFKKNGSNASTSLNLDPNGAFSNFIRIVNPSTVTGNVFLTITNDDGQSVNLDLNEVVVGGQPLSAELAGGASTRMIPIGAIVQAANDKDSTFGVVSQARNKFRLLVDAEFGSQTNPVIVNNVTLSNDDGSTFSTFE